jgi:hypothetical protein
MLFTGEKHRQTPPVKTPADTVRKMYRRVTLRVAGIFEKCKMKRLACQCYLRGKNTGRRRP